MDIKYELNINDIVSFTLFAYGYSPIPYESFRDNVKTVRDLLIGGFIILLIIGLLTFGLGNRTVGVALLAVAAFFIFFCLLYMYSMSNATKIVARSAMRMYGKYPEILEGEDKMTISLENVIVEATDAYLVYKWAAFLAVEKSEDYLYFVLKPGITGLIVPRRAFHDSESFDLFSDTAKQYLQDHYSAA